MPSLASLSLEDSKVVEERSSSMDMVLEGLFLGRREGKIE
jgi:hypothetical protein